MLRITKELISGWLKDMGLSPTPAPDPNGNWHFAVAIPPNQNERKVEVFGNKDMPRAVFIGANTVISPEHVATLMALDSDAKRQFATDLMTALNREFVEYNVEYEPVTGDVKNFVVTAVRYDDGLTLDSFARTVSSVFKAQIAGIQCVQQHLGGTTPPGGEFAFRKLGMQ